MSLKEYRKKRRFGVTPEPAGGKDGKGQSPFANFRRAEAPRHTTALRLPTGMEWDAALLGCSERSFARSFGETAGDAGGGSSDRVCKF